MGVRHVASVTLLATGIAEFLFGIAVRDALAPMVGLQAAEQGGFALIAACILHVFFGIWVLGSRVAGPWAALLTSGLVSLLTLLLLLGFGGQWPIDWYWLPLMVSLVLGLVALWALSLHLVTRTHPNAT